MKHTQSVGRSFTTRQRTSRAGFTLIELLIVIAIIAVLTGLIGSNYLTSRGRARDSERKNTLRQIQNALELYNHDNGKYPPSSIAFGNSKIGIPASAPSPIRWGEEAFTDRDNLTASSNHPEEIYMPILPSDPSAPGSQYHYEVDAAQTKYRLCAVLENEEDSDIQQDYPGKYCCEASGGGSCTVLCNYCVSSPNTTLTEVWQ